MPEIKHLPLYSDANLVAYWRLELDCTDETANDNDLTETNSPTHEAGAFGNGINFVRASTQYAVIADADQTGLDITGDFSATCWLNLATLPSASGDFYILSKWSTDRQYLWRILTSDNKMEAAWSTDGTLTNRLDSKCNVALTTGWVQVGFTLDVSAAEATFYINGSPVSTTNTEYGTFTGTNNAANDFVLGRYGVAYYDGIIDDVALFSRVLTPAEIQKIYISNIKKIAGVGNTTDIKRVSKIATKSSDLSGRALGTDADVAGYWRLEDLVDSSGNSHTLTNNNTATFVKGRFGDGVKLVKTSSQSLYVANHADFQFGTGAFTLSAWIKADSIGNYMGILALIDTDATGYRLSIQSDNTLRFYLNDNAHGSETAVNVTTTFAVVADTWYHVVAVRNGTTCKIYVNGVEEGTASDNTSLNCTNSTDPFAIGVYRSNSVSSLTFDGIIDDAGVWDRALTVAEILAMYQDNILAVSGVGN